MSASEHRPYACIDSQSGDRLPARSSLAVVALMALTAIVTVVASSAAAATAATESGQISGGERHLYRTLMIRAAPGSLQKVIDLYKERLPVYAASSSGGPFWMRHSQGDQWDLLVLFHLGESYREYYGNEACQRRIDAVRDSRVIEAAFQADLAPHVAWREELDVWGPAPDVVGARFEGMGLFHVEIFLAVAGKRHELLAQRQMENVYLEGIGRQQNLIFTRAGGAAWDAYTIGFYRDIKHYAESADIPLELQERSAVAAGFEGVSTIGTYLRELISSHHDTLAVAIR